MKRIKQTEEEIKYREPQMVILYRPVDYLHYKMQIQIDDERGRMPRFSNEPEKYPCLILSKLNDHAGNAPESYDNEIWYKEGHVCKECKHEHNDWPLSVKERIEKNN